jgi:glyceraldehyde 3-phosphate dehydrogenase
MFKYDTLMGIYPGNVELEGDMLIVNDYAIKIICQPDVALVYWKHYAIDWVVECSGHFTTKQKALAHIKSGAQRVLISAPTVDDDVSIIPGVNHEQFNPATHHIVSLGSCTTNALIPLLYVLDQNFEIQHGFASTTHAYTNSQVLLDVEAKDLRASRAAALNIIPTTTGASSMLGKVLPALDGKIMMSAIRVPVGKVSLIDVVVQLKKSATRDEVNAAFITAARAKLQGILDVTIDPLVSSDFSGNNNSVIIDSLLTQSLANSVHVYGWYDNEWAYSVRLKDFLIYSVTCF